MVVVLPVLDGEMVDPLLMAASGSERTAGADMVSGSSSWCPCRGPFLGELTSHPSMHAFAVAFMSIIGVFLVSSASIRST